MRRYHVTGITIVALAALLAGLEACSDTPLPEQQPIDPGSDFGITDLALGQEVSGCSTNVTGALVNGVLTISQFNSAANNYVHALVISAPLGNLKMNGISCVNAAGDPLIAGTGGGSTDKVSKIVVTAVNDNANDKVLLDLYGANFDNVLKNGNGVDVNLGISGTGNGIDSFMVRGTSGDDTIKIARAGVLDYVNIMANGTDAIADIRANNHEILGMSLGAGNDVEAVVASVSPTWKFGGTNVVGTLGPTTTKLLVYGGDDNDTLTDGRGNDTLYGGNGNDTITPYVTKETTSAGNTADLFYGGDGINDYANAVDVINYSGRSAAVTVSLDGTGVSGEANERDAVYTDFEVVYGGPGNDTLTGSPSGNSVETFYGGNGADVITGGNGWDVVYGGNGNDTLSGANGNDFLYGENGDDNLMAASAADGTDTLSGGNGTDVADFSLRTSVVTATISGNGGDTGEGDLIGQSNDIEQLRGGTGNDVLSGGANGDTIWGGNGNDIIDGAGGVDYLYGGEGTDTISGNSGDDVIFGEAGADNLGGNDGDDAISCGGDNDTAAGGNGADYLFGEDGNDSLDGGNGTDFLYAGNGTDTMTGGTVNDGDTCFLGSTALASASNNCDIIPY